MKYQEGSNSMKGVVMMALLGLLVVSSILVVPTIAAPVLDTSSNSNDQDSGSVLFSYYFPSSQLSPFHLN